MKTIILPGYSSKNRDWATEVKNNLSKDNGVVIHEWRHWNSGSFYLPHESKVIQNSIREEKVNLLAKSVGTRVVMELAQKILDKINKVILCGIPTKFESDGSIELYTKGLSALSAERVVCFQNTRDPFAPYETTKKFIHSINPDIRVIEKDRSDHHYPYYKEFKKILT